MQVCAGLHIWRPISCRCGSWWSHRWACYKATSVSWHIIGNISTALQCIRHGKAVQKVGTRAGAGPAGLSAALAIRAAMPAVAITVLERARAMHPNGGNIGLIAGPLFKAFRAIGPNVEQAVLDASLVRHTMITCDKDGSNRKEMKNVNARNASWYDLQQALLSQLPEGIVQLGHGVQEVRACAHVEAAYAGDT